MKKHLTEKYKKIQENFQKNLMKQHLTENVRNFKKISRNFKKFFLLISMIRMWSKAR